MRVKDSGLKLKCLMFWLWGFGFWVEKLGSAWG